MGKYDNVIKINLEDGEFDPEAIKEASDNVVGPTVGFFLPNAPDTIKSYRIPWGYKLDPKKGIEHKDGEKSAKLVSKYIVLIESLISDPDGAIDSSASLIVLNTANGKWFRPKKEMLIANLTTADAWKQISDERMLLGEDARKGLARFTEQFFILNSDDIVVRQLVKQLGWNEELQAFMPFSDQPIKVDTLPGTVAEQFLKSIVEDRSEGSKEFCFKIIEEVKEYPVMLACIAGMLAAPLMSWSPQRENIGIDIFAGTSTGKTAMQSIALRTIHGRIESHKTWDDTPASTWELVQFGNGIPFIFDDSHQISKDDREIPHSIINGVGRKKMAEGSAAGFKRFATMVSKSFASVYFFNGENPIVSKVIAGGKSAGIKGRILAFKGRPWYDKHGVMLEDGEQIDVWKDESYNYGGWFIKPWMEHINTIKKMEFTKGVSEVNRRLRKDLEINEIQGRLITKTAILSWTLAEFGRHFGIDLDIAAMEENTMKVVMQVGDTERLSTDKIGMLMDHIADHMKYNSDGVVAGPINKSETVHAGNVGIYGIRGEYLAIHKDLVDEVCKKNYQGNTNEFLEIMKSDDLLIKAESDGNRAWTRITRKKLHDTDDIKVLSGQWQGIKIKWSAVEKFFEAE
jgi:hypothetical protein